MPDLTDFQLEVTRLFFSLPASKGFLLAGGAALHRSGPRPRARGPRRAGSRSTEGGWATERIHDSDTFCRFVIRSDTGEVATENGSPTSSVSEKLVDRYCFRILFLNCDVSPAGVCRSRQR
jgi:hypothetical protein